MRYVIDNDLGRIIAENSYYIDPDGNQYPPEWPKDGLPGLSKITETAPPEYDPATQAVSDSIELIDGVYTVVWAIRDFTSEELAAIEAARIDALRREMPVPPSDTTVTAAPATGVNRQGSSVVIKAGESTGKAASSVEIYTARAGRYGEKPNQPKLALGLSGAAFGFDVTPEDKHTITGSAVDPVLAQLLKALHAHGIVIDNTTKAGQ
jgi:hypothetical protein